MVYLEIGAVLLLTLVNGVLAMSELALVSSRRSRLQQMAAEGHRGARQALDLLDHPGRFLSTVQIGITLVGVVAGAFSGATLGDRLGDWLDRFPALAPHGDAFGIGVTVVAITYLSLIVGELVPKRVALGRPEHVACLVAGPMRMLSWLAAPAVAVLHVSSNVVLGLLGLSGERESSVTEEEIKALLVEATHKGIFVPREQELIEGVLRLADRPVRVIMTPRSRIAWIDVHAGRATILEEVEEHGHARLLVCEGSVDHPVGFVDARELLSQALRGEDLRPGDLMKPPVYVPDRTTVLKLLNVFQRDRIHLAVVLDEYGTTEGLVTLTDVLEAIVGELPEHGDDDEPQLVRRDDGSWLVDGLLPTDVLEAATGLDLGGGEVQTTAVFVLEHLGRIPAVGAGFTFGPARFEVVDMDGNRIDKILVELTDETPPETDEAEEGEG